MFGSCRKLDRDSAGNVTKSLGYTGNVGEDICQITNKHHFGLEVSSTSSLLR